MKNTKQNFSGLIVTTGQCISELDSIELFNKIIKYEASSIIGRVMWSMQRPFSTILKYLYTYIGIANFTISDKVLHHMLNELKVSIYKSIEPLGSCIIIASLDIDLVRYILTNLSDNIKEQLSDKDKDLIVQYNIDRLCKIFSIKLVRKGCMNRYGIESKCAENADLTTLQILNPNCVNNAGWQDKLVSSTASRLAYEISLRDLKYSNEFSNSFENIVNLLSSKIRGRRFSDGSPVTLEALIIDAENNIPFNINIGTIKNHIRNELRYINSLIGTQCYHVLRLEKIFRILNLI